MKVKRWDLGFFKLPIREEDGSVQGGERLCLVISNDACNRYSPVIHIIPLTSEIKKMNMPVHVFAPKKDMFLVNDFGVYDESILLCEQLRAIDITKIRYRIIGSIRDKEMKEKIKKAIRVQLGL